MIFRRRPLIHPNLSVSALKRKMRLRRSSLVTRAPITGNLDTPVEFRVQARRWVDALPLAQGEGPLMCTRMAYFDRQAVGAGDGGYLRVFKGVVEGHKGLAELVHGAAGEWREVMVVLCRWAEADGFAGLVGELGERTWGAADEDEEGGMGNAERRSAARVCFMAGKRLDKLVQIWAEEMYGERSKPMALREDGIMACARRLCRRLS